jgi:hypothetical protein
MKSYIKSPSRWASLPSHSRRMLSRSRAARTAPSSLAHLHEDGAAVHVSEGPDS